jgi:protein-disulfide isomerase
MTSPKSSKNLFPILSLLSLAGGIISIWQTHLYFLTRSGMGEMHSFCNIGQTFDCTATEMSKFAEFFPGFPLSAVAIAGYLFILIVSLFGFSDSLQKNVRKYLVALTGVALLFSVFYLVIMLTQVGKLCLFCLSVDAVNVAMFIVALKLPKNPEDHRSTGVKPMQFLGAGLASLVIAFLFAKGLDPQADMKREDMNDIIENVMTAPIVPVEIPADAPMVGDPNAKVTIVKFSDYQCPACKMGATAIHPLFKRYKEGVKFVFVNFPLATECNPDPQLKRTMHEFACEAAAVAVCATQQGKFLETYETLFENQASFAEGKIADLVTSNVPGIDAAKLKACMILPSTAQKIKSDASVGIGLKIQSTPTFFVNGRKVEGGLPTNLWIEIIDRLLKQ